MRNPGIAAGLAVLMGAGPATATEVVCVLKGIEREVRVVHSPEKRPVCQVHYVKPDEDGTDRVLWYAQRNRGFCHARADSLIAGLARAGWVCDVKPKVREARQAPPVLGGEPVVLPVTPVSETR